MNILIKNGLIVNENKQFIGYIITQDNFIKTVCSGKFEGNETQFDRVVDASQSYVMPGVIDDQVHFREPGLTYKADIASESRAAVAGGVTSFMEMPNTSPATISFDALDWKFDKAAENSMANYSFYFGASNTNAELLEKLPIDKVCGIKVFMGSSTGDMLVDREATLSNIFQRAPIIVATHCEDNNTIKNNIKELETKYATFDATHHPLIRSAEACYVSSSKAVELATKFNTKLHVLHISTAKEMSLFDSKPLADKQITSEVCVHHLWFSDEDYAFKGNLIKWNPAIKSTEDRDALRQSLISGKIDIVATDHAPHTLEEKMLPFMDAPSGGPLVQYSLLSMLQMTKNIFTVEQVVEKMCHNPAILFQIDRRGYLREGYYADIVVVKKEMPMLVEKTNIISKCGWSPLEGYTFRNSVTNTIINGQMVYDNGKLKDDFRGMALKFNR